MKRAWSWLAALGATITALVYFWLAGRQEKRKQVLADRAIEVARDIEKTVGDTQQARALERAAAKKAEAAVLEGEARIHDIRKGSKSMAELVDGYRRRRLQRDRRS